MVGSFFHPNMQKASLNEKTRHLNGDGFTFEGAAGVAPPHLYKIIKLTVAHHERPKWTFKLSS